MLGRDADMLDGVARGGFRRDDQHVGLGGRDHIRQAQVGIDDLDLGKAGADQPAADGLDVQRVGVMRVAHEQDPQHPAAGSRRGRCGGGGRWGRVASCHG